MTDALIMQVRPPVPDVLGPEYPGLAQAVDDVGTGLRRPRRVIGIGPVIELAGRNIVAEIILVVGRGGNKRVAMPRLVAPVRQRRIIVDTDRADRRGCP